MFIPRGAAIILRGATNGTRLISSNAAVSVSLISKLRKDTGASIQKCKDALQETGGDMKKAIEFLRKRGENINSRMNGPQGVGSRVAATRSPDFKRLIISRTTSMTDFASESELFVKFSECVNRSLSNIRGDQPISTSALSILPRFAEQVHGSTLQEVVSELSSILSEPVTVSNVDVLEGDLVCMYLHGKSQYSSNVGSMASAVSFKFREPLSLHSEQSLALASLGDCIARQILATSPRFVSSDDVPAAEMVKEREALASRLKNAGAIDKAFSGHWRKFIAENCLLNMEWIIPMPGQDVPDGSTVGAVMETVTAKLGLPQGVISIDQFVIRK